MSNFYKYFKENMSALGLPAPESLFGTVQATVGTVTVLFGLIDKFGTRVTLAELIGAGTKLEKPGVVAACSAVFHAWAVVGSLAVATGRCLGNGTSLGDVLVLAAKWGFRRPWLAALLHRLPGVYDPNVKSRQYYKHREAVR